MDKVHKCVYFYSMSTYEDQGNVPTENEDHDSIDNGSEMQDSTPGGTSAQDAPKETLLVKPRYVIGEEAPEVTAKMWEAANPQWINNHDNPAIIMGTAGEMELPVEGTFFIDTEAIPKGVFDESKFLEQMNSIGYLILEPKPGHDAYGFPITN